MVNDRALGSGRALPDCLSSRLPERCHKAASTAWSRFDLNLATEAKLRNTINDKNTGTRCILKNSALTRHLASPPARPIGKNETGILSNKQGDERIAAQGEFLGNILKIIALTLICLRLLKDVGEALNDALSVISATSVRFPSPQILRPS